MNSYLIEMFGISLALTIVVELAVVSLLERKQHNVPMESVERKNMRNIFLLAILVNILTNPSAVLLCWLGRIYMPDVPHLLLQLAVETVVVAVEACIYRSFAEKPGWEIDRPVRLTVTANVCSWLLGVFFALSRFRFGEYVMRR